MDAMTLLSGLTHVFQILMLLSYPVVLAFIPSQPENEKEAVRAGRLTVLLWSVTLLWFAIDFGLSYQFGSEHLVMLRMLPFFVQMSIVQKLLASKNPTLGRPLEGSTRVAPLVNRALDRIVPAAAWYIPWMVFPGLLCISAIGYSRSDLPLGIGAMLIVGSVLSLATLASGPTLVSLMLDSVSEPIDIGNSAQLQQSYGKFRRARSWTCYYSVVGTTLLWAVFAAVIPWVLRFSVPGGIGSYPGQVGPNPGEVGGFIGSIGGIAGGTLGVLGATMGTYFAVWRAKLNRMVQDLNSGHSPEGAVPSGG